jgi:tRNA modification GTPase
MLLQLDDTIGALASAAGPAGCGIIRVSGPATVASVGGFFEPTDEGRWKSARVAAAHRGLLRLAAVSAPLPVCVYLWPTGRSYTGQPVAEIHAPGSPPLLEAILADLFERGVRPAAAGEFTLRAFLSGRIDLVQAEAVLGVIDAADADHLKSALRQLAGGVSARIGRLRDGLIDLLADLEAGLDFVDEDIQFVSRDETCRRIAAAEDELDDLLAQCDSRMQSTGKVRVVLAGLPNAGKSTLFNALLGRDAALVSRTAGTTRDYLSGTTDWHGLAVELIDTAGWQRHQESERPAEALKDLPSKGISQAAQDLGQNQWQQADLVVWCSACDLELSERQREAELLAALHRDGRPLVFVHTKSDLTASSRDVGLAVSAISRQGLAELTTECVRMLSGPSGRSSDLIGTTAARCRESLAHSRESMSRARLAAEGSTGDELLAVEIREVLDHLGRILGTVYTDDILDRIFSRFCIGK